MRFRPLVKTLLQKKPLCKRAKDKSPKKKKKKNIPARERCEEVLNKSLSGGIFLHNEAALLGGQVMATRTTLLAQRY